MIVRQLRYFFSFFFLVFCLQDWWLCWLGSWPSGFAFAAQGRGGEKGKKGRGGKQSNNPNAATYLLAGFGIQQDPPQLNHLGGILGDVDAMLVTGGCDVDDNVAIQLGGGSRNCHRSRRGG